MAASPKIIPGRSPDRSLPPADTISVDTVSTTCLKKALDAYSSGGERVVIVIDRAIPCEISHRPADRLVVGNVTVAPGYVKVLDSLDRVTELGHADFGEFIELARQQRALDFQLPVPL